jgi:hypothetical protein
MFAISVVDVLNWLLRGGQLYWAIPVSKDSLVAEIQSDKPTSLLRFLINYVQEKLYSGYIQFRSLVT